MGILEQTFNIVVNNNKIKVTRGNHDTIRPSVDDMSKFKYILEDAGFIEDPQSDHPAQWAEIEW